MLLELSFLIEFLFQFTSIKKFSIGIKNSEYIEINSSALLLHLSALISFSVSSSTFPIDAAIFYISFFGSPFLMMQA